MGNANASPSAPPGPEDSSHSGNLNTNMLRHRDDDVMSKYTVVKTIGEGSMGAISKAKIKEDKIGGSAYQTNDDGICGCFPHPFKKNKPQNGAVSERNGRRETEVFYALKTIMINRISPEFVEELRNEIDILKSLDHPNIVKVRYVPDTPGEFLNASC
jgi:serine/threonine protein kinase